MIPKVIHYCWFGGNPLPESALKCIESWKKYCPDYEIKEWNETNIDVTSVDYMREAYEVKAWGFVPDVARLQIIYECGGIYLDTDVEIIKSFDPLLQHDAFMGIETGTTKRNNFIALGLGFGAERRNELIGYLLNDYKKKHFNSNERKEDPLPAPLLQLPLFVEKGFTEKNELQIVGGATVYPSDFFSPLSVITGALTITENTYSIHHYNASWASEDGKEYIKMRQTVYQKWGILARVIWAAKSIKLKMNSLGFNKTILLLLDKLKLYFRKNL